MRHWLLTNTTYGTWLPGSQRGSVTSVRDLRPGDAVTAFRVEHDKPGDAWEASIPGLHSSAQRLMKGPPIYLNASQAEALLVQFQETATFREWQLCAVSIMANHFHLVVGVCSDPDPRKILADIKAYGSRALNREFGEPQSETWWTTRGSKRKLRDEKAVGAAIQYVLYKQPSPLIVWSHNLGRLK